MSMSDATTGHSAGLRAGRSRDAAASKDALLQAARALFGQRGFEGTTIREIGEQAGVDAALIARYFGSKADLYIAAVMAEDAEERPGAYEGLEQMADVAMTQADRRGPGPILQAIVRSDTSAEIRAAARDLLEPRLAAPLAARMTAQGVDQPQLRAEVAVSRCSASCSVAHWDGSTRSGWCPATSSSPSSLTPSARSPGTVPSDRALVLTER